MSKERVQKLAKAIEKNLIYDDYNDTFLEANAGEVYEKNLPDVLTKEILEELKAYNRDYIKASAIAFGNACLEEVKEHPDLDRFDTQLKMDNSYLCLYMNTVPDERQFSNTMHGEAIICIDDDDEIQTEFRNISKFLLEKLAGKTT